MKKVNIPKGWERCNPSECTHAWSSSGEKTLGEVEHKSNNKTTLLWIGSTAIHEGHWPILGIIPIRKSPPPEPIEFVVGEIEFLAPPRGYDVIRKPEGVKPGMRFREVRE